MPGPDDPRSDAPGLTDPLGLIAAAVPLGVVTGTLLTTATVFAVTIMRERPAASPSAIQNLLIAGTFAGVLLAAVTCWYALSPVSNQYRRGMFATVAGFATVVMMLPAVPLYSLFGRGGLAGLAVACVAGIAWLTRRVGRIRAAE